ncbi:MAG: hypothetical protein N4A33_03450 [Bacteriovoracaceae bacterium]|nr:hypothetical protein [Bacteriovoracaceae bacterium]
MSEKFYSKIMLFGEYGVIKGADALLIPFCDYNGHLEKTNLEVDMSLWNFYKFLNKSRFLKDLLDLNLLKEDIESGLRFVSSIPQGMGLGSSGALSSAILMKYKVKDLDLNDTELLQEYLSMMEAFFHGKSSGIDPLVSLLEKSIYIDSEKNLKRIEKPALESFGVFNLYNSNIQRKTAPLVHQFLKDYSNPSFKEEVLRMIQISNKCIKCIIDGDENSFKGYIKELSQIQLKTFTKMIPKQVQKIWQKGIDDNSYYFKLCGAGGGGHFICYSENEIDLKNLKLIR